MPAIALNCAKWAASSVNPAAAILPRKWLRREVPGTSSIFGLRCNIIFRPAHPQIHSRHLIKAKPREVIRDRFAQEIRATIQNLAASIIAPRANLSSQHQIGRIGEQRLMDQFIGHIRPIEIAGVDDQHPKPRPHVKPRGPQWDRRAGRKHAAPPVASRHSPCG